MKKPLRLFGLYYLARFLSIPFVLIILGAAAFFGLEGETAFMLVPVTAFAFLAVLVVVYMKRRNRGQR